MVARPLITLHAPMARALALPIVRCIETKIQGRVGIGHVWLSIDQLPDIVVMAEVPGPEEGPGHE